MKYLIDTSVISDIIKNYSTVSERAYSITPGLIAISTITLFETEYGMSLDPRKISRVRASLEALMKDAHILPFTEEDAKYAGMVRAMLKKQGTPIGPYDVLLAGCALSRDLIFVTSNTDEFSRVKGLQTENWRLNNS